MSEKLNLVQVFVATKAFLDIEFFMNFSDGLDVIHSGFAINKCKKKWQQEPETWDPSVWINWMKASSEILKTEIADPAIILVDELQGYRIMKKYIQNFAYKFEFQDLIELFKKLDIDQTVNFKKSEIWENWLLCTNATLQNKLTMDGCLLSFEFLISKDQAFQIMINFLNEYSLTTTKQTELAVLLQKLKIDNESSVIYQDWLAIYKELQNEHNSDGTISIIQAFNAMRIFLEKYTKKSKNSGLVTFLKLLEVDTEHIPVEYQITWNWLNAAYDVVLTNLKK